MKIRSVYLIGSKSTSGTYSKFINYVTSGNFTHVGILFYVSKNNDPIPPVDTSIQNIKNFILVNNINTAGKLKITIPEFNEQIKIPHGFYVFETSNDLIDTNHTKKIIKHENQSSGCVITPLETYYCAYRYNYIIELLPDEDILISLIKSFWGRPYGIDSILANLNTSSSMVCTHLCQRYFNSVYSDNVDMFSPTAFIIHVEKKVGKNNVFVDDFLDQKMNETHTVLSGSIVLTLIVLSLVIFILTALDKKIDFSKI